MNWQNGPKATTARRRSRLAPWVALGLTTFGGAARAADEDALWALWLRHEAAPDGQAGIAADCRAFAARTPPDPLAPVARGLGAWHLLKLRQHDAAAELLTPLLERAGTAAPEEAGAEIARAWLTRLDMLAVRAALQRYYARHVGYPESLEALKAGAGESLPPMADRWRNPWRYQLTGFDALPNMRDQRYALWSHQLGRDDTLEQALGKAYGGTITLQPVSVMRAGARPMARLSGGGESATLQVGTRGGSVMLAYLGRRLVILADRDYWGVTLIP
jgi:hypothetical protein